MATIAYYIGENRVLIDEEFLPLITSRRWHLDRNNYVVSTNNKLDRNRTGQKDCKLYRILMGAKKGEQVDHINGDTLDNRLANLRICSALENMRNTPARKNSSSKFKGVSICKRSGDKLWISQIRIATKKNAFLGRFSSEEAAAKAYDEAAKIYFGEFARLNFPEKYGDVEISGVYYQADFKSITISKHFGVSYDKRKIKKPWYAYVYLRGKIVRAGTFVTEEDAARAHDKKSWELFKDLSKLNFPEEYENMM